MGKSGAVLNVFKQCLDPAGIDRTAADVDVQSLRKTFCTRMAHREPRLALKELMRVCRHRNIKTTMTYYIEADESAIRHAVEGLEAEGTA